MNLADYEKMDKTTTDYVSFTENGETRYFRFVYKSGGEKMGEDIEVRRKKWNDETKKFEYDTPDGSLIASLHCIEYDADGKNPRLVVWERSAYFCKNVLIPAWRNYPRIIDGVWKVTASNPKTIDASYSLFPVVNADTIKFPIIEEQAVKADVAAPKAGDGATANATATPAPTGDKPATPEKKKYWEE